MGVWWHTGSMAEGSERLWWQRMVEASAESDKDRGADPLEPGEKLVALLGLAMSLPRSYRPELEYPPFPARPNPEP